MKESPKDSLIDALSVPVAIVLVLTLLWGFGKLLEAIAHAS